MESIHCSSLTKTKTVKTKVRSVFNVVSQCHSKTQGEKKTQVSSLCDIASLRCTKTKTRRRPVSIAVSHSQTFPVVPQESKDTSRGGRAAEAGDGDTCREAGGG